jgi:hypothetical protein
MAYEPSTLFHWCGQGPFIRPTQFPVAISQDPTRNMNEVGPFAQRMRFCAQRQQHIVTPIVCLRHPCAPQAVVSAVRPIIVTAFYRQRCGRAQSHIGQKLHKVMPGLRDGNPTPSIVRIGFVARVVTAIHDASPDVVLCRHVASASSVMPRIFLSGAFPHPTSTACSMSLQQMSRLDRDLFSTAALTHKPCADTGAHIAVEHRQTSKRFSGQINEVFHWKGPSIHKGIPGEVSGWQGMNLPRLQPLPLRDSIQQFLYKVNKNNGLRSFR